MTDNGIDIRGITLAYQGTPVLRGVDLAVNGGETVALIGPSGAGKSTLLRCLNGLVSFDAGEVRMGNHILGPKHRGDEHALRLAFGMVFQDFQLFPHLDTLANVSMAQVHVLGRKRSEADERSRGLLERVGLSHRLHAYPHELSGGQKQRVAIARALAMGPRGLLCDEITSALDPELKHEVLSVLEDLRRDGLTILMVTHEIGFARRAADRVAVLAEGRVVETGIPAEVLDRPQHERTRTFLQRVMPTA